MKTARYPPFCAPLPKAEIALPIRTSFHFYAVTFKKIADRQISLAVATFAREHLDIILRGAEVEVLQIFKIALEPREGIGVVMTPANSSSVDCPPFPR